MKTKHFILFALAVLIIILLFSKTRDVLGDINNDGFINIIDVVLVVDIILTDGAEYGDYELWASDVNADDETNVSDIVIIVEVILGTQEECPPGYANCIDNLTECCIDTSSHVFYWEIDSVGYDGSGETGGSFNDVCIVDSNNVWAAGQITIGPNYDDRCNLGYWNGVEWELFRVLNPDWGSYMEFDCVHAFSNDDVWACTSAAYHWDGVEWDVFGSSNSGWEVQGYINDIWGSSPSNIYYVGDDRTFIHFDGDDFIPIDTDVYCDLRLVRGTADGEHVFVVGNSISGQYVGRSCVLELNEGVWNTLYYCSSYMPGYNNHGMVQALYVAADTAYFATKAGLWKYNYLTEESIVIPAADIYMEGRDVRMMAGNGNNDLMMITNWYELIHFNGWSWILDEQFYDTYGARHVSSRSIDMEGEFVVGVGSVTSLGGGFVTRGYR